MSEWQPIETAPKDGTGVLVYQRFSPSREVVTHAWFVRTGRRKGTWFSYGDYGDDEFSQPYRPTHWMPLPKPPEPKP